jgi:hypothetical protein
MKYFHELAVATQEYNGNYCIKVSQNGSNRIDVIMLQKHVYVLNTVHVRVVYNIIIIVRSCITDP